jgi:hypothetical protein
LLISNITAALLAGSALPPAPCPIVVGTEHLTSPTTRWLIVGEPHGTNEVPEAFGDLVCAISIHRPTTVALEQPVSEQAAIDAFMASNGGMEATAAFLRSAIWTNALKDGRSSRAMFRLFERLRRLQRQGRIDRVVAFQPTGATNAAAFEQAMARILVRAAKRNGVVVALVGNVHAGRQSVSFGGPTYLPMAALLPRAGTITLDAQAQGGEQWACMSMTECGPQRLTEVGTGQSGIIISRKGASPYTGIFSLGVPATASGPQ